MAPFKKFVPASVLMVFFALFLIQTSSSKVSQEMPGRKENPLLIQNESAGLRGAMAFRVTDVQSDSPAARAGLQANDLIFAVDDVPVYSREELDRTLLQPWLNPGAKLAVTFGRFDLQTGRLEIEKRTIQAR